MEQDAVCIREATPDDAAAIAAIYRPYVTDTAITFECQAPSDAEMRRRMEAVMDRYPFFVAVSDGSVIGYAYAGPFKARAAYRYAAELTVYLKQGLQKRGVGGRLYRTLEAALGEMGILNLYACIGYPETEDEFLTRNSAEFHAHMGFVPAGRFRRCGYKFGRWYDMIWMEKIIGAHEALMPPVQWRHSGP